MCYIVVGPIWQYANHKGQDDRELCNLVIGLKMASKLRPEDRWRRSDGNCFNIKSNSGFSLVELQIGYGAKSWGLGSSGCWMGDGIIGGLYIGCGSC